MIDISRLAFSYNHKAVLCGIDIHAKPGEIVSVIGPNGSGKSTLLRCMNKILKFKQGAVLLAGKNIDGIPLRQLSRTMGYIPQHETRSFAFTVFETVLMGRRPHIGWQVADHDLKVVHDTLHDLGLDALRNRQIDELSGGERQRVFIARALAQEPSVMLMDEPTSDLDPRHQLEVFGLITELSREKGITVVCAIHDLHLAARFSDKIVMLRQGEVFAQGPPQEVMTPGNLRAVYGVEAFICHNGGSIHVVVQKAL
jgi:iron complex transport system ATP-binding protein